MGITNNGRKASLGKMKRTFLSHPLICDLYRIRHQGAKETFGFMFVERWVVHGENGGDLALSAFRTIPVDGNGGVVDARGLLGKF